MTRLVSPAPNDEAGTSEGASMSEPQQNPVAGIVLGLNSQSSAAPNLAAGVPRPRSLAEVLKDIALFFAAPLITIAYLALFPFIGLRMLIQTGSQARHRQSDEV
jgi:hypothetical protein